MRPTYAITSENTEITENIEITTEDMDSTEDFKKKLNSGFPLMFLLYGLLDLCG